MLVATVLAALVAAAPPMWSPARMAQVAPTLPGPTVNLNGLARSTFPVGTPSCVGIGSAVKGSYPGFRCSVSWKRGVLEKGVAPLWVRPQASGYCLSSTAFAGCPASFRPDDPRACGRVVESCSASAAGLATARKLRASGVIAVNLQCTFRSALVSRCEWLSGSAVVTFRLGDAGWKPEVVLQN